METTRATSVPTPGAFLVSVEDISQFSKFKKAIQMMRGVTKVQLQPRKRRLTGLELSALDKKAGRINEYASVDDYFKSLHI